MSLFNYSELVRIVNCLQQQVTALQNAYTKLSATGSGVSLSNYGIGIIPVANGTTEYEHTYMDGTAAFTITLPNTGYNVSTSNDTSAYGGFEINTNKDGYEWAWSTTNTPEVESVISYTIKIEDTKLTITVGDEIPVSITITISESMTDVLTISDFNETVSTYNYIA